MILPAPAVRYEQQNEAQTRAALARTVADLQQRVQALEATTSRVFNVVIDGGGSAITPGIKGEVTVPKGRVTGWQIRADQTGSIVVDVLKSTGGGAFGTIAGTEKPTLSSAILASDTALTSWSPATVAGDVLRFTVDSASTVTRVTVSLTFIQVA